MGLTMFIFLQISLLLTSTNLISQCNRLKLRSSEEEDQEEEQCQNSSFISTWVLIPLFIHTILFCSAVGTFLWRAEDDPQTPAAPIPPKVSKTYEYANITIVIEEVP
jgi:heme/copper-type cytochrome/quinol oxidase subunit 2